jgi:AcrR family transcriptional regulator
MIADSGLRLVSSSSDLPPRAHDSSTRGRILLVALRLFAEQGFQATTIREIAAGVGLTSASLYTHFSAKEDILAELVTCGNEEHHARVVHALLDAGGDPRDQLRAIIRAHLEVHCEYSRLATVAIQEMRSLPPSAAAPSLLLRKQTVDLVHEVLRRGKREGVFDIENVAATTLALGGLGLRLAFWYPADEIGLDPAALTEAFAELALRMAGALPKSLTSAQHVSPDVSRAAAPAPTTEST